MVFTTGQMLGIGLFTVVVLAVGGLLLKLQSMIDGNAEMAEAEQAVTAQAQSSEPDAAAKKRQGTPRRKRRH